MKIWWEGNMKRGELISMSSFLCHIINTKRGEIRQENFTKVHKVFSVNEDYFLPNVYIRERMGHCIMRQVKYENPPNFDLKMCQRRIVCFLLD